MKSRTRSKPSSARVADDVRVQLSLSVAGVLRDVQSAFFGLCGCAGSSWLRDAQERSARTALMNRGEGVFCQLDLARVRGHVARRSALIGTRSGGRSASRRATGPYRRYGRGEACTLNKEKGHALVALLVAEFVIRPRGSHRARA